MKNTGCCFPEEKKYKAFGFVFFSTVRETEKCSQAGCGLSGAAARALSITGTLGNTSGSKTRISLRCKLRAGTGFLKEIIFSTVGQKSWKELHSQYV